MHYEPDKPVAAASALVVNGERVLLIRRRKEPDAGRWGLPGGRIAWGETAEAAAVREVWEETGVTSRPLASLGYLEIIDRAERGRPAWHFLIAIVRCEAQDVEPVAGDDALEAGWFSLAEASALPTFRSYDVMALLADALAGAVNATS